MKSFLVQGSLFSCTMGILHTELLVLGDVLKRLENKDRSLQGLHATSA